MDLKDIRDRYINFMIKNGHTKIESASLVPKEDATTLFTGSGMQPLLPYLLGQEHQLGTRLVNSQKCFRAGDIEEVGDNRHTTFFEMLGNWSLGDYFKKEQIKFIFNFLTDKKEGLGLDPRKLYVTVFIGDSKYNLERDNTSAEIWKQLFEEVGVKAEFADIGTVENGDKTGMKKDERIFFYDSDKNWWSRSGAPEKMPNGEPGGPDTEVFYDFGGDAVVKNWKGKPHPNSESGQFVEIANSVFMQYLKKDDEFVNLPKKNVDFGGGLERMLAACENNKDIFLTPAFKPLMEVFSNEKEYAEAPVSVRIICDHIKASCFLIADGVLPSNVDRGYLVRRLIRRAYFHLVFVLNKKTTSLSEIVPEVVKMYSDIYPELKEIDIAKIIETEESKFNKTLQKGLKLIEKLTREHKISDENVFKLFSTYGIPFELIKDIFSKKGIQLNEENFDRIIEKHREVSRKGSGKKFKGGLADVSEMTVKYHTATHLLHQALRDVLGDHVLQKGSNITKDRLRFDFSHDSKLTEEEKKKVEDIVNKQIQSNLTVKYRDIPKEQALAEGAIGMFGEKYGDTVRVYDIGEFSKEFCGGPHVENIGELGVFSIKKEESIASGIRRIKAVLI